MGTPSLLDSNCAIYLIKGGLDKSVEQELRKATTLGFNLSVISQIELLGYDFPTMEVKLKTEKFIRLMIIAAFPFVVWYTICLSCEIITKISSNQIRNFG